LVYRKTEGIVYRNSTGRGATRTESPGFLVENRFSADYHQQYLAKNPGGYCPDHSCGIPYKSPVSAVGEKA
jgi:hypothetical protein